MESITKYRQSPQTLRRMIERAYGPELVPAGDDFAAELGHGWFNVAYLLRLADDREVVMKIAPPPGIEVMTYETDMLAGEVAAIRLIEQATSVPVPHVDHYDPSCELIAAPWFVMTRVPGENFGEVSEHWSHDRSQAVWREIGAANAELNTILGDGFGRYGLPGVPSWREAFTGILEDVLADGERRDVDLGWSYEEIRQAIADHEACLDAVTVPRFCEWDLWGSNVMVGDDRITGIIDHERAFWGDPIMEAGFLAAGGTGSTDDATGFLAGYGRGPLSPDELDRRHLYNLHLFLIMVIETVYRGHTTTAQLDMARPALDGAMADLGHRHEQ
jgi:aminoglycoside phosphotransferase (APT) family kinase protein